MNKLLLSIPETANALGISRRSVFRYIEYGLLKAVHVGRRRMVPVSAVLKMAEEGISVERLRRVKEQLAAK